MKHFKIELDGNHFTESYLVYVIEVNNHESGRFFYVGQTGDRNHFTARPAFRRLSAHLSDQGRSTENQLYRHIASKILNLQIERNKVFDAATKTKVGNFLKNSRICMHVFPIRPFETNMISEHKANREFVESIENAVILAISNRFGLNSVLNSRVPQAKAKVTEGIDNYVSDIINTACP